MSISTSSTPPVPETRSVQVKPSRLRLRTGVITTLIGLFIFTVGAKPNWYGWDRSPTVGFIQIAVFLIGLAIICLGGYMGLLGLWKGINRTIVADIGLRLVATGYVISVFAGLADVFGMGSQPLPQVPYFGPWQATGVVIGEALIAIGFLMLIPYRWRR
jgi:xanthine/uracil permease